MNKIVILTVGVSLGLVAGILMRAGGARPRRSRHQGGAHEEGMDGAVEGTFPASDPPATMGSLVSGAPSRSSYPN